MASVQHMAAVTALDAASADTGTAAPVLEPTTRKFVDALVAADAPPIYTLTPGAARKVLSDAQAGPDRGPPADSEERKIPVGPKGWKRIHIVRPQGIEERLPGADLSSRRRLDPGWFRHP